MISCIIWKKSISFGVFFFLVIFSNFGPEKLNGWRKSEYNLFFVYYGSWNMIIFFLIWGQGQPSMASKYQKTVFIVIIWR